MPAIGKLFFIAWTAIAIACATPLGKRTTSTAPVAQQGAPIAESRGVFPAKLMTFTAPPVYLDWWHAIERCSGIQKDMHSVGFALVGSPLFVFSGERGLRFRAAAYLPPDSIYLGLFSAGDSAVVMHEMLHAIRPGADGERDGGHPRQDFAGACRALVAHGDEDSARARP